MKTETKNPILDLLFAGHQMRLVPREPEPWLVLSDVCSALGLSNPSMVLKPVPKKWVSALSITEGRSADSIARKRGENATRSNRATVA